MDTIYLILVIFLFFLAISDLVVGVANDAVNFLNSAVGSRASTFKVIMAVAALGVLIGATFSSGMMEVARKGIFNPQYFYFDEIIILFLAVMLTDVLLLDAFNTFGLPTSTTVSIVFELLGAAVAVALIKVYNDPDALPLYEYINSARALGIISGILLSIVVAFTFGALIQYLSRLLFSFDFERRMRRYGALWGGLAVSVILYFILVKGIEGASFLSEEDMVFISDNSMNILLLSFAGTTLILQILIWVARVNILKFIVLFGTFALAMAFAGNDLVNFIGVPLAGYNAYLLFVENGGAAGGSLLMEGLAGESSYTDALAGSVRPGHGDHPLYFPEGPLGHQNLPRPRKAGHRLRAVSLFHAFPVDCAQFCGHGPVGRAETTRPAQTKHRHAFRPEAICRNAK
jgi:phosphate/sulfate permease